MLRQTGTPAVLLQYEAVPVTLYLTGTGFTVTVALPVIVSSQRVVVFVAITKYVPAGCIPKQIEEPVPITGEPMFVPLDFNWYLIPVSELLKQTWTPATLLQYDAVPVTLYLIGTGFTVTVAFPVIVSSQKVVVFVAITKYVPAWCIPKHIWEPVPATGDPIFVPFLSW